MQACQQQHAARGGGRPPASPSATGGTPPAPPVAPDALPKVELEMPVMPGPEPNGPSSPPPGEMPSLFQPAPREPEGGTALRIIKPSAPPDRVAETSPPVRMRFPSSGDDWSTAAASAQEPPATPRTAATSAAPRRPQWSPYR
jgi:hypothetical protein